MFRAKKNPYHEEISHLDAELREIDREVVRLEKNLRQAGGPVIPRPPPRAKTSAGGEKGAPSSPTEDRKRFVSYLSTGSFQTIRDYKFRSDLIRKKRILWTVAILLAAAAIYAAYHFLKPQEAEGDAKAVVGEVK
jgi:hypothetical protein